MIYLKIPIGNKAHEYTTFILHIHIGPDKFVICVAVDRKYCKVRNFRENFIFENALKDIFAINCDRFMDVPTSVNDIVISPYFAIS